MKHLSIVLSLALLIALPAIGSAETTPEAQAWLSKLVGVYDQDPISADFTATMGGESGQGSVPQGTMTGDILVGGQAKMRMNMNMNIDLGGNVMEMSTLMVGDGTTMWTQANLGPMGTQVTKIDVADAKKMAEGQGFSGVGSMDPVAQIQQMTEVMDFVVLDEAATTVTLRGDLTDEGKAKAPQLAGVDTMRISLDKATGFPTHIKLGEPAMMEMTFDNIQTLKHSEVPAGTFDYQPPEGVQVIDAGAAAASPSAQSQGGAPASR